MPRGEATMIGRRGFFAAALAAGAASAQESDRSPKPKDPPAKNAKVTKLYRSPDLHPNGLEATSDGLWIGDQVSESVNNVDWKTGKVLRSFATEAHNSSGIAVGAGSVWIACNGGVSNRRPARPNHRPIAEVLQADPVEKRSSGTKCLGSLGSMGLLTSSRPGVCGPRAELEYHR